LEEISLEEKKSATKIPNSIKECDNFLDLPIEKGLIKIL